VLARFDGGAAAELIAGWRDNGKLKRKIDMKKALIIRIYHWTGMEVTLSIMQRSAESSLRVPNSSSARRTTNFF